MVFFRSDRRVGGFVDSEGITSCFVRALGGLGDFFGLSAFVRVKVRFELRSSEN